MNATTAAPAESLPSPLAARAGGWTLGTYCMILALSVGMVVAAIGLVVLRQTLSLNAISEAGILGGATAKVAAQAVDGDIAARTANVLILSEVATRENIWGQWDVMRSRLETIQKRNPSISWIGATDATGRIVVASGKLAEGIDVGHRTWFLGGIKGLYHGDVHEAQVLARSLPPLPAGEPWRFIDIAAPVKDKDGRVVGVMALHLSWPWMRDVLEQAAATATGHDVWLVGPDNVARHGGISSAPMQLESIERARAGQAGWLVETWPDGVRYVTGYAPNKGHVDFPGLGWTTLVRLPADLLPAGDQQLWRGALVAAAALVLLLTALAWLATRTWLTPLTGFTRHLSRLDDGDAAPALPLRLPVEFHDLNRGIVRLVSRLNAKHAQVSAALERLEVSFQSVGSSFPGVLGSGNIQDGRLVLDYASAGLEHYLGVSSAAVLAAPEAWSARVHPDDLAAFEQGLAGVAAHCDRMNRQALRVRDRDGTLRVMQSTLVRRDDMASPRVDWILVDSTDLVAARAEAERADQTKAEFLSVMSQEIRTPLTAIMGFSRVLEDSLPEPAHRKHARFIRETAEVLTRVLNDVLDLASVDSGRFTMEARAFQLAQVIEAARTIARVSATEKSLALHIEVPADIPDLVGDPIRLRQVLEHLLNNAIKFTTAGSVTLRASIQKIQKTQSGYREAHVRIRITDTGIGMSQGQMARIFGRFEQADRSIKHRFGGAGLGLAISQTLTQMMGGRIEVVSVEGNGSQFTVSVPFPIADDALAAVKSAAASKEPRMLVVVADGLYLNRIVLRSMLEARGHRVVEAADGHEALAKVREVLPDLLLADVDLPAMDGLQLTRRLRNDLATSREITVYGLLGRAATVDRTGCLAAGMDGCLHKPVSAQELATMLQAAAGKGHSHNETSE